MNKDILSHHKIISIVSQLPPEVNGVGDYAFYLAEKLKSDFGIETFFIRTEVSFIVQSQNKIKEETLQEKTSAILFRKLENQNINFIILHYVGYAYSPRGCPYWLVDGIENWKKKNPDRKVTTIFHELYASGKIWQSAFWLHILQKRLVFRLLKLSNCAITNSKVTYNILKSRSSYKDDLLTIPVFSNVGEPLQVPEQKERDNVLVIFGSEVKRNEIYSDSFSSLLKWLGKLSIKKIIEIGPLRREKVKGTEYLEIIQMGVLDPLEIGNILIQCKYGLLQYPLALLSKSGIFAAYTSHGVVPIVLGNHFMNYESDGLRSGVHYLFDPTLETDNDAISKNGFKWYQEHRLSYLSAQIFDLIRKTERI